MKKIYFNCNITLLILFLHATNGKFRVKILHLENDLFQKLCSENELEKQIVRQHSHKKEGAQKYSQIL